MAATVTRQQKTTELHGQEETLTVLNHVRELQVRLLVTAAVLVAAGIVAFMNYEQILDILRRPLNAPLYINSVSGSFAFVMKICFVAGIAVSVPLIIYNLIMFVRPAFTTVFTKKRVILMTLGSVIAAAAGGLFGYLFIIPGAIHFFGGFGGHGLHQMTSADSYLNFVVNVLVTFILMFQLPIVASLIDRIKPMSPRMFWKGEKWALAASVVVSFIVPFAMDFMTQLLIAAPIFLLYNVSYVVISLQHAYGKRAENATTKKTERETSREAKANLKARVKANQATNHAPAFKRLRTQAHRPVAIAIPTPATAPAVSLTPHPQLAEILSMQEPAVAAPVVTTAAAASVTTKPARDTPKPITHRPAVFSDFAGPVRSHPTVNATAEAPAVIVAKPIGTHTMDIIPAQTSLRTTPANVIRRAGPVPIPQRAHAPLQPGMRLV